MVDNPVDMSDMKNAINTVATECAGNLPITFVIGNSAADLYGEKTVKSYPDLGVAQGVFFIKGDIDGLANGPHIYLNCAEIKKTPDQLEALTVVRHEVLGHYGINTLTQEKKDNLLSTIIKNREQPGLKERWEVVDRYYPALSDKEKAEEVFCFTAEAKPKLDLQFDLSSQPFTLQHVEQVAARIAEGIRLGQRTQQVFPEKNSAQFSQSLQASAEFSVNYQWSQKARKMAVTINDQEPSKINPDLLAKIAKSDRFLSSLPLSQVQSGFVDLKLAGGIQPVPRTYNSQGKAVITPDTSKHLKLN